jgi:hypothetical protein
MSVPDGVFKDAAELLIVAQRLWLADQAAQMRDLTANRQTQAKQDAYRAYLETLGEHRKQVAEIDAQIELLAVSPRLPVRETLIRQLQAVRQELFAKSPSPFPRDRLNGLL